MKSLKNALLSAFCFLNVIVLYSFVQYGANSFSLLNKQNIKAIKISNHVQCYSGKLTFKVNNYFLDADSAVIFEKEHRFEAYGNITFRDSKNKRISSDRAFYRQEDHIINFSANVSSFAENTKIGETNSAASYDVAQ